MNIQDCINKLHFLYPDSYISIMCHFASHVAAEGKRQETETEWRVYVANEVDITLPSYDAVCSFINGHIKNNTAESLLALIGGDSNG